MAVSPFFTMRPDEELKMLLMRELCAILDGWSQVEAAASMDLHQSELSRLRRGAASRFSISRLIRLIADRGYNIELRVSAMQKRFGSPRPMPTVSVVRFDRYGMPSPNVRTSNPTRRN